MQTTAPSRFTATALACARPGRGSTGNEDFRSTSGRSSGTLGQPSFRRRNRVQRGTPMAVEPHIVDEQLQALGQETYNAYKDGKVLQYLPDILSPDETIRGMSAGTIAKRGWLFVITDARILMLTKGFFRKFRFQEIAIEHIDGVQFVPGMMFDKVLLVVRGARVVMQLIIKGDAPKIAELIGTLMQAQDTEIGPENEQA